MRGTPLLDGRRNLLFGHAAVRHGDDVLSRQIGLRPDPLRLVQESLLILRRPADSGLRRRRPSAVRRTAKAAGPVLRRIGCR